MSPAEELKRYTYIIPTVEKRGKKEKRNVQVCDSRKRGSD